MNTDTVGVVTGISRETGVLNGGDYWQRGRGSFEDEFGASHCNQWRLLCSYAEVHEWMELFGHGQNRYSP